MLRDNYKKAFSQINPSEETIERIFEMTEKKRLKRMPKGLIIAIALVATLLFGALTANAATNGALFDGISLIMNSEEVNLKDYIIYYNPSSVDEEGNKVEVYKVDLDGEGNGEPPVTFEVDETGDVHISTVLNVTLENEDNGHVEYSLDLYESAKKVISAFDESYEGD